MRWTLSLARRIDALASRAAGLERATANAGIELQRVRLEKARVDALARRLSRHARPKAA